MKIATRSAATASVVSLRVGESVAKVKRHFSMSVGCSARWRWQHRAGTSPPGVVRGRRVRLPSDALVELEGGRAHRIGEWIGVGTGGLPQWWAAGGRDLELPVTQRVTAMEEKRDRPPLGDSVSSRRRP